MNTTTSRQPGRRVQRAQHRKAGTFRTAAKQRRLVHRFGIKGAAAYVPGLPIVNEHKDRTLAGKARRRAERAGREIVGGFACSCGARAYLVKADDNPEGRAWFDGLYDAHAGCDEYDGEASA